METKSRLTITVDKGVAVEIDALCYPIPRSAFLNALLKESLKMLKDKKITLSELSSPVLRKTLIEYCTKYGGMEYA